jgi:hypothetical protein
MADKDRLLTPDGEAREDLEVVELEDRLDLAVDGLGLIVEGCDCGCPCHPSR